MLCVKNCYALLLTLFLLILYRWLGLVGQFRPKKLISNIKREFSNVDELEVSLFRDTTKHIFDKSLYSVGVCSQLALTPSSSLLWNTERHGERKGLRHKFMLYHKARFSISFNSHF